MLLAELQNSIQNNEVSMPAGRPTKYNKKLAEEICDAIATGIIGLERLCQAHDHWPESKIIYNWIIKHPEFKQLYIEAKQNQQHKFNEELTEVAYHPEYTNEVTEEFSDPDDPSTKTIRKVVIKDNVARSRLKYEALKWQLARLNPQKYGDKTILSGDANNPLQIISRHLNVDDLSESEEVK